MSWVRGGMGKGKLGPGEPEQIAPSLGHRVGSWGSVLRATGDSEGSDEGCSLPLKRASGSRMEGRQEACW